ncbi:MAG: HAD hydrolase-like protein, partial [Clostridia bacterium]|nr:HAD hydrolase-like protein [Clostridia bacterium]
QRVFDTLNVTKDDCVMVGDMKSDYLVGVNSGVEPICVLWGYGDKDHLSSLGCENFVDTPSDLLKSLI